MELVQLLASASWAHVNAIWGSLEVVFIFRSLVKSSRTSWLWILDKEKRKLQKHMARQERRPLEEQIEESSTRISAKAEGKRKIVFRTKSETMAMTERALFKIPQKIAKSIGPTSFHA